MADKVLIYSRFPKTMMARFAERFELLDTGGKPAHEVFSAGELGGIRAMLTAGGSPLGAEAMDLFPELGAIVCYGTGYDGVDLKAAAARNIAVGHSPGANAASVADIAMTLMLATTRRILVADQYVRSGDWAASKQSPMPAAPPSRARSAISAGPNTICPINISPRWRRWPTGAAC